jgi:hypothetical protein
MPVESKFRRVPEDDPNRCKAAGGQGQCHYRRTENSEYCPMHGGNKGEEAAERESLRVYRLSKWRGRMDEIADHPQVKSLREEIAVLRILLEEQMNKCNDAADLILTSNRISDLVIKIEKVVSSCHRLEASTGQLLDKTMAMNFATQIVEIVDRHVRDPEIIDQITNEVLQALTQLTSVSRKVVVNGKDSA